MAGDWIDDSHEEEREEDEGDELDPLRHHAADDGRGRPRKDELEEEFRLERHARPVERREDPDVGVTDGRAVL